ncbi:MAG: phosphoribosylformylglycinamidine synthase subunit PurL [Acidimicrobiia bacterium]|nr:phosphoribosylformylglycinamidine synthase subunit PurL [Acidimicrobiia bacterium]
MESNYAIVIGPGITEIGAEGAVEKAKLFGIEVDQIVGYRLVHLRGRLEQSELEALADRLLIDRVGQWWMLRDEHLTPDGLGEVTAIEVGLRPGVTDREGAELVRAAESLGFDVTAATIGRRFFVYGQVGQAQIYELVSRVLHNEVIERWNFNQLAPGFTDDTATAPLTEHIDIGALDRDGLAELSSTRRLGLTVDELEAIQKWFNSHGRRPTDAELETLAQTWSEHCSHKTFRATIDTPDGVVDGLLKTFLRGATEAISAPWVESAFVDNAGIVRFDETHDLALKAETHNHPSALEPFGGANTGVGGVVRDILGVSAKPIAITDILCFGPEDVDSRTLPPGVLHPRRIRSGVIAGIADYGNKIGVPNIAGAVFHDPSYTTTPLVFAGCIGLLPRGSNPTRPQVGDYVVVLGGKVGRDGVGGATFSSQTMSNTTAEVAGSSVQIGDPVVEKGLIDVVVAARDRGLYNAITDCGAGGLSSAVGEMADELGARVDLAAVPLKYAGLAPWEVWLSEAQERMVVACTDPDPLLALARRWQVEAHVIGHFTGDGRLTVVDGGEAVVDIDTEFLHNGRPPLRLAAGMVDTTRPPRTDPGSLPEGVTANEALLALLSHPSIRSNEAVIRGYDHEVLGGTVVRPYGGAALDGPADGTAIIPPGTGPSEHTVLEQVDGPRPVRAAVVGIGAAILVGRHDPEAMAWAAIDEAVRNAVVGGADPRQLSLLDNFAWGNPHRPEALAGLVAACRGCHDAAIAHGAPFVSGKDSLFNEFVYEHGSPDPVTPTLIITAVGIAEDVSRIPSTGVVANGNDIWLVGPPSGHLGGSYLDEVTGGDRGGDVPPPDPGAVLRHRQLHRAIASGLVPSAHDLSEGGLAVAAAEWAFAGRLGMTLSVASSHGPAELFGEGAGRYLVEVAPDDADMFAELVPSATRIGWVTDDGRLRIGVEVDVSLDEIGAAFIGPDYHPVAANLIARAPAPDGAPDAIGADPDDNGDEQP